MDVKKLGYGPWMGGVDNMASDLLFSLDVEQCNEREAREVAYGSSSRPHGY